MPLYPWLHLLPSGKVFVSGPGEDTGLIDTSGEGSWQLLGKTNHGYRGDYEATSVMYEPGKILIAGGVPSTASAETIDLTSVEPVWKEIAGMNFPRHRLTSTILADGNVLVIGGSSIDSNSDDFSVYAAELWNPQTGVWSELDHMSIPRLYHSTSVLLPDGRVLSQGGGLGAGYTTHKNSQIYSPPYLFKGERPKLKVNKDSFVYGSTLKIDTNEAKRIALVHMIRLSSDTHSFNSSQHRIPLLFTPTTDHLDAILPSNGAFAPPGHYLLFIVNELGVPSEGRIIQLRKN